MNHQQLKRREEKRNIVTIQQGLMAVELCAYNGALELSLKDVLAVIKPVEEDVLTRARVIRDFRDAVVSMPSLKDATVEPFGSFVSNLYTRCGDLDISVEVPNGFIISETKKKHKHKFLKDIRRALQLRELARNIQFIPGARVPLLVFQSNHRNISCDISIGNLSGLIKSKFLLWLTEIDERFRDMVLLVKEWAKSQNINDPKSGTLNSYSLTLLVIFHFQTCKPAILPPLYEIYDGNITSDLKGERLDAEKSIQDICSANIARFKSSLRNANRSSLSELFLSFFDKFSQINQQFALCTYTGQWEHTRIKIRWANKDYSLLVIEDPLEHSENTARAVSDNGYMRICRAFGVTSHNLRTNQDRVSLITSVVRPQIKSLCISRSAGGIPSVLPQISGFETHPSQNNYLGRPVTTVPVNQYQLNTGFDTRSSQNRYSPRLATNVPENQNQRQNMGIETQTPVNYSRSLTSTINPQQATSSQDQQQWRPKNFNRWE
ncbi:hypothetical protein GIB67_032654 [Kingdonia uniflora]|uniref:Poly(A) RNA polymerase mitochondrial-like central palm domain-containing protein n=1 Tax=Kingdonia uniflora TaxID=39325 RepID=A0A7J7P9B1_9MAGN|nr:hypothetical protein GIB67_032654 [Kingdonia uniflora]